MPRHKARGWPESIRQDPGVLTLDENGRFILCRVCSDHFAAHGGKKPKPVAMNARFRTRAWEVHKLRTKAHRSVGREQHDQAPAVDLGDERGPRHQLRIDELSERIETAADFLVAADDQALCSETVEELVLNPPPPIHDPDPDAESQLPPSLSPIASLLVGVVPTDPDPALVGPLQLPDEADLVPAAPVCSNSADTHDLFAPLINPKTSVLPDTEPERGASLFDLDLSPAKRTDLLIETLAVEELAICQSVDQSGEHKARYWSLMRSIYSSARRTRASQSRLERATLGRERAARSGPHEGCEGCRNDRVLIRAIDELTDTLRKGQRVRKRQGRRSDKKSLHAIRELTLALAKMHSSHMSTVARLIRLQEQELDVMQRVADRFLQQEPETGDGLRRSVGG